LIRKFLREPLVHFLALGAALFFLYSVVGNRNELQSEKIVVTSGKIDQIITTFSRTWQRPPSPEELNGLIEDDIREEVISREAMAMGLNKDDTIIRRRLRQKFEFLMEDAETASEPTDQDLQSWFNKNSEKNHTEPQFSFLHVYVNANRRGGEALADANTMLVHLNDPHNKIDPSEFGDQTLLPSEFSLSPSGEIAKVFGDQFVQQLEKIEVGRWSGPLQSTFGLSLVFLRERTESRDKTFEEMRDQAKREWVIARRQEIAEATYRKLREKYSIIVETLQPQDIKPRQSGELPRSIQSQ
jgi:hypothetical protein